MTCCASLCGIEAPLGLEQISGSGLPQRRGICTLSNGAGGGRPRHADLSSGLYLSVRREGLCSRGSRFAGTGFTSIFESFPYHGKGRVCLMMASAEKEEQASAEEVEEASAVGNTRAPITIKRSEFLTSPDFFVQLGIFVLAAGFVDAGFSGDWSRIGVLSPETEEELQWAAIGVVPLAATLIWSIYKRNRDL